MSLTNIFQVIWLFLGIAGLMTTLQSTLAFAPSRFLSFFLALMFIFGAIISFFLTSWIPLLVFPLIYFLIARPIVLYQKKKKPDSDELNNI
jgi:Ca2+/Na+ antiporter